MRMKTKDLIGVQLDWAVARSIGKRPSLFVLSKTGDLYHEHHYSRDWAVAGPIIESLMIETYWHSALECWAAKYDGILRYGPSLLVAAMRCAVASKIGDEIDVPKELVQ